MEKSPFASVVRFVFVLLLVASPVLCTTGPGDGPTPSVDTMRLLARLRTILRERPLRTDALVDSILSGPFETTFEPAVAEGSDTRREGRTRANVSVGVYTTSFPDGSREVLVILGPMHVLSLQDIRGTLVDARLSWITNPDDPKAVSRRLYRDPAAAKQRTGAWSAYCEKISRERPELPPLELPERYREPFVTLYEPPGAGVFGDFCDVAGVPPAGRVAQMKLVAGRRTTALRYALRAPSAVSRLYAAEGLLVLQRSGSRLAPADAALVERLGRDSELVETCSGCEHTKTSVRDVLDRRSIEPLPSFIKHFKEAGYLD